MTSDVYAIREFDDHIFVVDVMGRLTNVELKSALDEIWQRADPPHAVIFAATSEAVFTQSTLRFYEQDRGRSMPAHVAVVTENPLHRMVVRAAGVGFSLLTKKYLQSFDTVGEAIAKVQP